MLSNAFTDQCSIADISITNSVLPIRMLTMPQVADKIGLGRTKIHEMMASGEFPRSVSIGGGRAMRFVESEIDQWLLDQIQKSRTETHVKPKVWVKRREKVASGVPAKVDAEFSAEGGAQ